MVRVPVSGHVGREPRVNQGFDNEQREVLIRRWEVVLCRGRERIQGGRNGIFSGQTAKRQNGHPALSGRPDTGATFRAAKSPVLLPKPAKCTKSTNGSQQTRRSHDGEDAR
ncbi:hypothetical protein HPB47_000457 [Ixodes persulcatus]|uniref:Uncharacterized protein n=1 Tax=Ixodes persulcatus TaxID=34615 RepID=A0AC60PRY2_IXOPE|nr:hypothetical protein HPB47_000457 [Ixodes persulcatus]